MIVLFVIRNEVAFAFLNSITIAIFHIIAEYYQEVKCNKMNFYLYLLMLLAIMATNIRFRQHFICKGFLLGHYLHFSQILSRYMKAIIYQQHCYQLTPHFSQFCFTCHYKLMPEINCKNYFFFSQLHLLLFLYRYSSFLIPNFSWNLLYLIFYYKYCLLK